MGQMGLQVVLTGNDGHSEWDPIIIDTTITSLTKLERRQWVISTATTQNIWDPLAEATESMSDFDFFCIWADGTVYLEDVVDDGDEVGKVVSSKPIIANVPFMLGADDAYADVGADDAFSGTLDLIERWRISNVSGADRTVYVIMGT